MKKNVYQEYRRCRRVCGTYRCELLTRHASGLCADCRLGLSTERATRQPGTS